jgi:PAS domain S-box-containing protein
VKTKKGIVVDSGLRHRAEDLLRQEGKESGVSPGEHDALRTVHELQVHQIELELQNEELKRTREELEQQVEKYSDLYNFAPVGYFMLDNRGAILEVNLTGAKLLDVDRSNIIGIHFNSFLSPKSLREFNDWFAKMFNGETSDARELRLFTKDNQPRYVHIEGTSVESRDDAVLRCRMVVIDITDRKLAEEALKNSERLYRAIGESINYGVWVCEPDGRNIYASDSFLKMVGLTQDQCANFGWGDAMHPDDAEKTISAWRECVKVEGVWDIEHRFLGADGQVHYVLARGIPVRDDQGKIVSWAGINLDIDRQKQLEEALRFHQQELITANLQLRKNRDELELRIQERTEELQAAYDQLKKETEERLRAETQLRQAQKMEAVGTLAGGIAHDLNNILAAVMGFTEIAIDTSPEGSHARRSMERVLAAGLRGRELVRQILVFSRQGDYEKQPLKLAKLVKETASFLRASLPSTIDILMNIQDSIGFVLADPIHIQQIVLNLCTNAAYAMRGTGGRISIDLAGFDVSSIDIAPDPAMSPGLYVRLAVVDTGEGMPSETLERIFDPFFTTKPVGDGTGLGLSVVHGIVTSYGGVITVSSEQGKGSTFTVYLPKLLEIPHTDSRNNDNTVLRGSERILFIDDEQDLADIGNEMLTNLGYQVISKTKPRDALTLFKQSPSQFDLVITDQTMPELTGEQLAREIVAIRPNIPIIMTTGYSTTLKATSMHSTGVRAFVTKPLTKKEISAIIRKVLDEMEDHPPPTCATVSSEGTDC